MKNNSRNSAISPISDQQYDPKLIDLDKSLSKDLYAHEAPKLKQKGVRPVSHYLRKDRKNMLEEYRKSNNC